MAKKIEVVIIGIGEFGTFLVEYLDGAKMFDIIAIDQNPEMLRKVRTKVIGAYTGNSTSVRFLDEIGIETADVIVVAIGDNTEASILTSSILKEKFPDKKIIAKASNELHERVLIQLGIHEVVLPERAASENAYKTITIPFMFSANTKTSDVTELEGGIVMIKKTTPPSTWGKMIKDIEIPKTITVVLLYRGTEALIVNGLTEIQEGDVFSIVGKRKDAIDYIRKSQKDNKK